MGCRFSSYAAGAVSKITVIDTAAQLGGWVRSSQEHGYTMEWGPRSIRAVGPGVPTMRLIDELGLNEKARPSVVTRAQISPGPLPVGDATSRSCQTALCDARRLPRSHAERYGRAGPLPSVQGSTARVAPAEGGHWSG